MASRAWPSGGEPRKPRRAGAPGLRHSRRRPPKIPPDAALHFAIKLLRVGDGEDAAKGGGARAARARRRPGGEAKLGRGPAPRASATAVSVR